MILNLRPVLEMKMDKSKNKTSQKKVDYIYLLFNIRERGVSSNTDVCKYLLCCLRVELSNTTLEVLVCLV